MRGASFSIVLRAVTSSHSFARGECHPARGLPRIDTAHWAHGERGTLHAPCVRADVLAPPRVTVRETTRALINCRDTGSDFDRSHRADACARAHALRNRHAFENNSRHRRPSEREGEFCNLRVSRRTTMQPIATDAIRYFEMGLAVINFQTRSHGRGKSTVPSR